MGITPSFEQDTCEHVPPVNDVDRAIATLTEIITIEQITRAAEDEKFETEIAAIWFTPEQFGAKGDGVTNDTLAMQALSASVNAAGGGIIRCKNNAIYRVGLQPTTLGAGPAYVGQQVLNFLNCNGILILGNGATFKNIDGLHYGSFNPATGVRYDPPAGGFGTTTYAASIGHIIQGTNCTKVTVQDLRIDGNSDNAILGGYYGDTGYQIPGDCMRWTTSSFIHLNNLELVNACHDNLYLNITGNANTGTAELTGSFLAENVLMDRAGRQGCSITGGSGFMFRNCRFTRSGQGQIHSPPMAGCDIEPTNRWASDITFEQCQFVANGGTQLIADSGTSLRTTLRRCVIWGGFDGTMGGLTNICGHALWIDKPDWTIEDSDIHGTFGTIYPGTQINRCQIDVAVHPIYGQSGTDQTYILNNPGGLVLHDCTVEIPVVAANYIQNSLMSAGSALTGPMYAYNCKFNFGGILGYTGSVGVLWNHIFEDCTFTGLQPVITTPRPQLGLGGGNPQFLGACYVVGNLRVSNYVDGQLPNTTGIVETQKTYQPTDNVATLNPITQEYRATLPTSGFYPVGSQVFNSANAPGVPEGWTCITAGAIATVARVPNKQYYVGDLYTNGGNSYRCTVAGISDATTGPITTSAANVDGTATFKYYTAPVWQPYNFDVPGVTEIFSSASTLAITAASTNTITFIAPFTNNKTATISTIGVISGRRYRIVRAATATGNFLLSINYNGVTLKTLAAGEWCEVEYDSIAGAFILIGSNSGSTQIGLFTSANAMLGVPTGTLILTTRGYRTIGIGGASYIRDDATVTSDFVAAHPTWSFMATDADGTVHGYRLMPNSDGAVKFDSFGAYGDGTFNQSTGAFTGTDDYPAWVAMNDFLLTTGTQTTNTFYRTVYPVQFSRAFYRFNSPLSLKTSAKLIGSGSSGSQDGGNGTVFICAGIRGITLESYNTINGAQDTSANLIGSFGCELDDITFYGASTAAGSNRHGMWVRGGSVKVRNCRILYFMDDGLRVGAGDTGGSDNLGIADNNYFENLISTYNNGNGVRCYGGDSNANTFINLTTNSNGLFGIWESSFLGNTYTGGQLDGNGHGKAGKPWDNAGPSSFCSYGGKLYGVVAGQQALASTTAPGSNTNVWYYYQDGAAAAPNIIAWVTGLTWISGGPALFDNANSPCTVVGMYLEGGLGLIQNSGGRAIFLNGIAAQSVLKGLGAIDATLGVVTSFGGLGTATAIADPVYGTSNTQQGGGNPADGIIQKMINTVVAPLGFAWAWNFTTKMLGLKYGGGDPEIMSIATPLSTRTYGRTAPLTNPALQVDELFIGVADNARNLTWSDSPSTGPAAKGDIILNINAAASGNVGWICTAAGNPGTWKTWGTISA